MKAFVLLSLISLLPVTSIAATTTPSSEQSLLTSCEALSDDPNQETAILCNYYVQGYIAGTLANDAANAIELAEAGRELSSFMERAYRTRIGSKEGRIGTSRFLHFCISEDASVSLVISRLSEHLSPPIKTIKVLRERLYSALQAEYPCSQSDQP